MGGALAGLKRMVEKHPVLTVYLRIAGVLLLLLLWFPPIWPLTSEEADVARSLQWSWINPCYAAALMLAVGLLVVTFDEHRTRMRVAVSLVLATIVLRSVYSLTLLG